VGCFAQTPALVAMTEVSFTRWRGDNVMLESKEYSKRWRERHPDRAKASTAKWREKNPNYFRDLYKRKKMERAKQVEQPANVE